MEIESAIDYPKRVEQALLGMVRDLLRDVAREGIPGGHGFYLTFSTSADGVEVPEPLRRRYPEEMTIILQHQFWDLVVDDQRFSVVLSFDRVRHSLSVPFSALSAFADPTAGFGLRFGAPPRETGDEEAEAGESGGEDGPQEAGKVVSLDSFRKNS